MKRTKWTPVVERNSKAQLDPIWNLGNTTVLVTPNINEDFWLLRVDVGYGQYVNCFPKFGIFGIGFAKEEVDWNTNLPPNVPAGEVYEHIKCNKGDRRIPKARVLAAIVALQTTLAEMTNDPRWGPSVDEPWEPGPNVRGLFGL